MRDADSGRRGGEDGGGAKKRPAEFRALAARLRGDGWDERYLAPLDAVKNAVRIGFCALDPPLERWSYGRGGRIVLLGDAAHPFVPYIGQGAQMGIEDAGVLALLLKALCLDGCGAFDVANFGRAVGIYQRMRIPRTSQILERSNYLGRMQQRRADEHKYNVVKEELIRRDVFFHETLPMLIPGAIYDYRRDVEKTLKKEPVILASVPESGIEVDLGEDEEIVAGVNHTVNSSVYTGAEIEVEINKDEDTIAVVNTAIDIRV